MSRFHEKVTLAMPQRITHDEWLNQHTDRYEMLTRSFDLFKRGRTEQELTAAADSFISASHVPREQAILLREIIPLWFAGQKRITALLSHDVDSKTLFKELTGRYPKGAMSISVGRTIHIRCENNDDYASLYHRCNTDTLSLADRNTATEEIKNVKGFCMRGSQTVWGIPIENIVTVSRHSLSPHNEQLVRAHEEMHGMLGLFSSALAKQSLLRATIHADREVMRLTSSLLSGRIEMKEAGLLYKKIALRHALYSRHSPEHLKEEILNRLNDKQDANSLQATVLGSYIDREIPRDKNVLQMYIAEFTSLRYRLKVNDIYKDTRYTYFPIDLRVILRIQLEEMVTNACLALKKLLEYGFGHEEIFLHLAPYDLSEWPVVARKITEAAPPDFLVTSSRKSR